MPIVSEETFLESGKLLRKNCQSRSTDTCAARSTHCPNFRGLFTSKVTWHYTWNLKPKRWIMRNLEWHIFMRNVDGDVLFRSRKGVGGGVRPCNIFTIPPPMVPPFNLCRRRSISKCYLRSMVSYQQWTWKQQLFKNFFQLYIHTRNLLKTISVSFCLAYLLQSYIFHLYVICRGKIFN